MPDTRPDVLIVGATPPPHNGVSLMLEYLLQSAVADQFKLAWLDITDRRDLTNMGKFEARNLALALQHGAQFVWLLIRRRPRIVYVCISQNVLGYLRDCLFLIPARLAGSKVVVHLHGGSFNQFYAGAPPLLRALIRWTLHDVRRALVLSEKLRAMFAGLVDESRVVVVPNGVPGDGLGPDAPAAGSDTAPQILYLSNLIRSKGFLDVLRAAPAILQHCPAARLIIAGPTVQPAMRDVAAGMVQANQLAGRVSFAGLVVGQNKTDLLRDSHVFVYPSYFRFEGQPLVILEAMAAGLPIVTTDQGAIAETVLDGINGFIVPARDPQALAEKVILLLQDEALRRQMGQAAMKRFRAHYTLQRFADDMARTFEQVLAEK